MSRPCLDGHLAPDAASRAHYLIIDDDYDRTRASDGISRFGAYLAMRLPAVLAADPEVLEDPQRWAAFVWATAAPPVMSPGYVDWEDPVEDVRIDWDDYGNLIAEVVVRTPVAMTGWRGWDTDWRGRLVEPFCAERVVLGRTILRAQLGETPLPRPPRDLSSRKELVVVAKATVRVIVAVLEDVTGPALARLADPA
jgi:hypothetical protein